MVLMEKRSIVTSVLLSVITCGIYTLYWDYKILDELYRANNIQSTAGTDILLGLVTCGIYNIYYHYKMGKMLNSAMISNGLPPKDDSILFVILPIFGLGIVVNCIVQNDFNVVLADRVNANFTNYNGN